MEFSHVSSLLPGTVDVGMEYVELVVVVPIYNEEKILEERVLSLHRFLSMMKHSFQLVLAVDDSGDNSVTIAQKFAASNSNVAIIVHDEKKGRGFAVREAWLKYNAKYYCFIDTDLAMGLDIIQKSLEEMSSDGYPIITASRYCSGAKVYRPELRNAVSRIYNYSLRILFNEELNDHQCGFKMIKREVRNSLVGKTTINSWFWDTELLIKGHNFGYEVKELPVTWVEGKYKHTSLKRLLKDVGLHGYGILRLLKDVREIKRLTEKSSKKEQRLTS